MSSSAAWVRWGKTRLSLSFLHQTATKFSLECYDEVGDLALYIYVFMYSFFKKVEGLIFAVLNWNLQKLRLYNQELPGLESEDNCATTLISAASCQ